MESNLSTRSEVVRALRALDGDQAILLLDEIKDSIKDEKDEKWKFPPSSSEEEKGRNAITRRPENPIDSNIEMLESVLCGLPSSLPVVKSRYPVTNSTDAKKNYDGIASRLVRDAKAFSDSSTDFVMGNGLEFLIGLQVYLEACEHARLVMSPEELSRVGKLPEEVFHGISVNSLKVIYRERIMSHKINSIGLLISNLHEEEFYRTKFYQTHKRLAFSSSLLEEVKPDSWSSKYR